MSSKVSSAVSSKKGDARYRRSSPDETLVEYLEGELEPSFEADLTLLLLNSRPDRARLEEFKNLRELIKGSDQVFLPENGATYQNLHDRIMTAIDERRRSREPKRAAKRSSARELAT
jgi:hypothetical protein